VGLFSGGMADRINATIINIRTGHTTSKIKIC
jgi:hypothetical protein